MDNDDLDACGVSEISGVPYKADKAGNPVSC